MWLLAFIAIPSCILVAGLVIGKGKITLKEFLLEEGVMVLLMIGAYFIGRYQSTSDTEIWNGWVAHADYYEEWWERVSCRHEIPCTHYDKKGNRKHANDGHRHAYDVDYHAPYWEAATSNGETLSIGQQKFEELAGLFKSRQWVDLNRWSKDHGPGNKFVATYQPGISALEPTATEHGFTNYIKASPGTLMRRIGQGEKFNAWIPEYPRADGFNCQRVLSLNVPLGDLAGWNKQLMDLNARLGSRKQVNVIFVVVPTEDSSYIHALEERWLGGKKNDLVIIVGSHEYPTIDWVRVMSWSRSEDLKVDLRDTLQEIGSLEKRDEILSKTEELIDQKFVRRPMADFEYLMSGWQPSCGILITLLIIGFVGSIGLTIYFIKEDPFGTR